MAISAEFSRIHPIAHLKVELERVVVEADAAERWALAQRLELIDIVSLRAEVALRRMEDGLIEVTGQLKSSVMQRCVVSLEPIPAAVAIDFRRLFANEGEEAELVEIDPDAELIEPLDGEILDLGEIVAEELSLALDPYPRAEAAEIANGDDEDDPNPFASLASLRRH